MRLTLAWCICLALAPALSTQSPLEVYFVNVDQGDATLIVSPSGRTLLIDGGDNGKGTDSRYPAHLAPVAGLPVPGQSLSLRLAGPAGRLHFVVAGTARATVPIPGGVTLGVAPDLLPLSFLLPNWIGSLGAGVAAAGLPLPAAPALTGQTIYLQLVVISGGQPEAASDVVRLRIG